MVSSYSKLKSLKYRPFSNMVAIGCVREHSPWSHLPLPLDYIEFLEAYPNTGIFDEEVACKGIESSECAPDGIYPITMLFATCDKESYDLIGLNNMDSDLPAYLLLIGDDVGGNYFCMDLREKEIGNIYFLDHEIPMESGLVLLASSFSDFVDRLLIY